LVLPAHSDESPNRLREWNLLRRIGRTLRMLVIRGYTKHNLECRHVAKWALLGSQLRGASTPVFPCVQRAHEIAEAAERIHVVGRRAFSGIIRLKLLGRHEPCSPRSIVSGAHATLSVGANYYQSEVGDLRVPFAIDENVGLSQS
jgi:hypothetical protein